MKTKTKLVLIGLTLMLIGTTLWYFKPIGTVEGPEWDILHVDGITYVSERSSAIDIPYNRSDKGRHLGIIKSGDYIFHIYEIKDDPERNYLYWTWEWEGEMYVRKELSDATNKPGISE